MFLRQMRLRRSASYGVRLNALTVVAESGRFLRQAERHRAPVQLQPMRRPLASRVIPADRRRKSAGRRVAQLAVKEMIAERLADQKAAHRTFAGNRGNARGRDHLAGRVVPHLLDARRCSGLKVEAEKQRRGRWREPQSVDREPEKAWIRPDPELAIRVPFQIVGAAGKVDRIPVRELFGGIGGIPGVTIESFGSGSRDIKLLAGMIESDAVGELNVFGHRVEAAAVPEDHRRPGESDPGLQRLPEGLAGPVIVGDVKTVAVESDQVIRADQVLRIRDGPDMLQGNRLVRGAGHIEHFHHVFCGATVADDHQPALAVRPAEQAASARMKRKAERLLIDQEALRQELAGKVERKDRSAWYVGGTQELTGRRLSLLRCRKSDSRGMINHDVFRSWNRHRSANDNLHALLSIIEI